MCLARPTSQQKYSFFFFLKFIRFGRIFFFKTCEKTNFLFLLCLNCAIGMQRNREFCVHEFPSLHQRERERVTFSFVLLKSTGFVAFCVLAELPKFSIFIIPLIIQLGYFLLTFLTNVLSGLPNLFWDESLSVFNQIFGLIDSSFLLKPQLVHRLVLLSLLFGSTFFSN